MAKHFGKNPFTGSTVHRSVLTTGKNTSVADHVSRVDYTVIESMTNIVSNYLTFPGLSRNYQWVNRVKQWLILVEAERDFLYHFTSYSLPLR
jgi:hypothetical protein